MSAPSSLKEVYIEELADSWSANDQMEKTVRKMADKAGDDTLADRLRKSADGIKQHTQTLMQLLGDLDSKEKEHCKGMEGLVTEAKKHALDASISDDDLRDVLIISQYQRMCHYGIAGFGTAKALAEALGMKEHVSKLDKMVEDIYDADANMSDLAERSVNLHAKEKTDA